MGTVTVDSVDLRFGKPGAGEVVALNGLSMVIPDKQFAVIVGPSGCGKSSLLDVIAGLRDPSGGVCKIDGKVIPLTGMIDPQLLLHGEGNTIIYENNDSMRDSLFELFSTAASPSSSAMSLNQLLFVVRVIPLVGLPLGSWVARKNSMRPSLPF